MDKFDDFLDSVKVFGGSVMRNAKCIYSFFRVWCL